MNNSIEMMTEWLSHPMEYGKVPDEITKVDSSIIEVLGFEDPMEIDIIEYIYNGIQGIGIVSDALTFSFRSKAANKVDNNIDDHILMYGGYVYYTYLQRNNMTKEMSIHSKLDYPPFESAVAYKRHLIGPFEMIEVAGGVNGVPYKSAAMVTERSRWDMASDHHLSFYSPIFYLLGGMGNQPLFLKKVAELRRRQGF